MEVPEGVELPQGSSPLARGPLFTGAEESEEGGLIPARAGTTKVHQW